jgi:hypothetical protein
MVSATLARATNSNDDDAGCFAVRLHDMMGCVIEDPRVRLSGLCIGDWVHVLFVMLTFAVRMTTLFSAPFRPKSFNPKISLVISAIPLDVYISGRHHATRLLVSN